MGFFSSVASILTGGVSDLVQGNSMFQGAKELYQKTPQLHWVVPYISTAYNLSEAIKNKDWGQGIDTILDSPQFGSIDYITRKDVSRTVPKSVKPYAKTLGTTIGSIWGPIGASAGYGIGSKINEEDYGKSLVGAGTVLAASYAAPYVSNALNGGVAGTVGGQLASTAIKTGGNMLQNYLTTNPADTQRAWDALKNYEKIAASNGQYTPQGFLNTPKLPSYTASQDTNVSPSFAKSAIPSLTKYGETTEQKLADILTDKYKSYTLNNYSLYKADPEVLQDIVDASYYA